MYNLRHECIRTATGGDPLAVDTRGGINTDAVGSCYQDESMYNIILLSFELIDIISDLNFLKQE